jgi:uncharacterized HAD superfamily protein
MRIGLDFDGVISDAGRLKSLGIEELFGLKIPPEEVKKELVISRRLLTAEQYRTMQKFIYESREIGLRMEPVPGVFEYLPRLTQDGHQIRIITSRDGQALEVAKEWTQNHKLKLECVGLGYGVEKTGAATGFNVFVDDDLDKLAPLKNMIPNLFLFSWGYNRHIDETGIARRVQSWEELYGRITDLDSIINIDEIG